MMQPDVRIAPAPVLQANRSRGLLRWVCTNNPFYVLSAGLFFMGLKLSFGTQSEVESWALLSGLAAYTLLLAVTALLLVRFARVWDDARTVLLLVVLMFLATSVAFDEMLALNPRQGCLFYVGGLLFAVALSEGLWRGIRLRLPMGYRLPYYLILCLFFLYPPALSPWLDQPHSEVLLWGLFGFSTVAGLIILTLLPAIRRGPSYVQDNGSPWTWPLYPWTLFGLLAFAVMGRAFLLCWSLHVLIEGNNLTQLIFGPYFLVPFGFALAVLLLEIGLVSQRRGALWTAFVAPVALTMLTMIGHRTDPIYQEFLEIFSNRLGGNPPFMALILAAGFYGYAMLRQVPMATEALTAVLVALALAGTDMGQLKEFAPLGATPLLLASLLQIGLGYQATQFLRCLAGAAGLVGFIVLGWPEHADAEELRAPVVFHVALLAMLVIGAAFDDVLGRILRLASAALVLAVCLAALTGQASRVGELPPWMAEAHALILTLILAGYGLLLGHRLSLIVVGLVWSCMLIVACWKGYVTLRLMIAGLDFLAGSLALFAVAVLVSLAKAGLLPWRLLLRPFVPGAQRGGSSATDVAAAYSAQARQVR